MRSGERSFALFYAKVGLMYEWLLSISVPIIYIVWLVSRGIPPQMKKDATHRRVRSYVSSHNHPILPQMIQSLIQLMIFLQQLLPLYSLYCIVWQCPCGAGGRLLFHISKNFINLGYGITFDLIQLGERFFESLVTTFLIVSVATYIVDSGYK